MKKEEMGIQFSDMSWKLVIMLPKQPPKSTKNAVKGPK